MTKNKNQAGFTLIELLVVIAIMGLLASIVMTSLNGARKSARDTRRIADLRQLNTAIQFYITDFGHAPYVGAFNCQASNAGDGGCAQINEINTAAWTALETELAPYLSRLPKDPCGIRCFDPSLGSTGYYAYIYVPPAALAAWCSCQSTNGQYAVYAEKMEVDSSLLNITYKGIPTFGFVNHDLGTSF